VIIPVSTPSYAGGHAEGYWRATRAVVEALAVRTRRDERLVGLCPGMLSPADLRHLRELLRAFELPHILFPDYSETLDGPSWADHIPLPAGGTTLEEMKRLGDCGTMIAFTTCAPTEARPGAALRRLGGVDLVDTPPPAGVAATDRFLKTLADLSGNPIPPELSAERGRLIDAYVDGHKITAGRRVAVFGEPDFVVGMSVFLVEIGLRPVLCAAGGPAPLFESALRDALPDLPPDTQVLSDVDFADIEAAIESNKPDLLVGSSKGYGLARRLNIPLMRAGFPVHDRVDGPRQLSVGYRGAQRLFDTVCNLLLEHDQNHSPVGYAYM
jgi:nitrogenase molybdenum-iron protein NifN